MYDRGGLEYLSETIFNLDKGQVGTAYENVENRSLNQAISVANSELPPLDGSESSTISINFKALETFEFIVENEPEEAE